MSKSPAASVKAAKSRLLGESLETYTLAELNRRGVVAHKIHTPTTVNRGRKVYTEKVAGDYFGITATGQAVLVECKHRTGPDGEPRMPRLSDFEAHQIANLREWERRGGLAMVAFWSDGQVSLCRASIILGDE